jgi:hypothetical protein
MPNAQKARQLSQFFIRETRRLNASPDEWFSAVSLIVGGMSYATGSPVTTICGFLSAAAGQGEVGPDRAALLLCEKIVEDGSTSTLTRLQERVTATSLPHTSSSLWAFARIAHCHGPAALMLEVASPNDELTTIHSEVVTPNADGVITWRCNLEGLQLNEPGKHMFSLEADGIPLAVYWYEVVVPPPGEAKQA